MRANFRTLQYLIKAVAAFRPIGSKMAGMRSVSLYLVLIILLRPATRLSVL